MPTSVHMSRDRGEHGFSLVELTVVVGIIAVLLVVGLFIVTTLLEPGIGTGTARVILLIGVVGIIVGVFFRDRLPGRGPDA